jgi:uncharacterized protein (DUF2164 family)
MLSESEIDAQLSEWYAALSAVSKGQEYTIGGIRNGRQLKRADLASIRDTIDWLEQKKKQASTGNTIRIRRVVL